MTGALTSVWLVRHAETDAPPGVAIGSTDLPLSLAGRQQALRVADQLAGRPLTRVVCSDLKRATATAEPIAESHGLSAERTAALREIDFGRWEGRPLAVLWEEAPDEAAAWEADLRRTPSGFGEAFAAFERRVQAFWHDLRPRVDGSEVALVSHRGPLVVLFQLLTGVPLEEAWQEPFALASATLVEVSSSKGIPPSRGATE